MFRGPNTDTVDQNVFLYNSFNLLISVTVLGSLSLPNSTVFELGNTKQLNRKISKKNLQLFNEISNIRKIMIASYGNDIIMSSTFNFK